MIESVHYQNFRVLRNSVLPLGRFTIIVGPNGSGKSTAVQALQIAPKEAGAIYSDLLTAGLTPDANVKVQIEVRWQTKAATKYIWSLEGYQPTAPHLQGISSEDDKSLRAKLREFRLFNLHAPAILMPVTLSPQLYLGNDGANLVGMLDQLRDRFPERFEALNNELGRWLPEFDRILFSTPGQGQRAFMLRTRQGQHPIKAPNISQGTLLALAILTVAYLPEPPPIVCFEEPDRGLHPRLLRDVRDALYRLSYPENFKEERDPVQVIATTHSPYMLDLFKDHPEEVVISQKTKDNVIFEKLSERPDLTEILEGAHLGDVWYSGILGGVPAEQ